jgi:hypothetical protein
MKFKVKYNWNWFFHWDMSKNDNDKFSYRIKVVSSERCLSKEQRQQLLNEILNIK